jgi:predicted DNA-binding protein
MSVEETLAAEAAHAEANRDASPAPGVRAQRRAGGGNPAVLSVRLTKEQYDQLSERAARAGVPTSALAREVILASLGDADGDRVAAKLEEVLRRTLSPDLLAS